MTELLQHLGKDTFPEAMIREFISWCIWDQAVPALLNILEKVGLHDDAAAIRAVDDVHGLMLTSDRAGRNAHEARGSTGPLGLSTAEAAAFLTRKLAEASIHDEMDAEAIAFYAMQVCGWNGYAVSNYSDQQVKQHAEEAARKQQNEQLQLLWKRYSA
jgi:hypothetical protein